MTVLPAFDDIADELVPATVATAGSAAPVTRSDGLVRIHLVSPTDEIDIAPFEDDLTSSLIPANLLVDYVAALTSATVKKIRSGDVEELDVIHQHPVRMTCIRCAVHGASRTRTLATALMEMLDRANETNESWNNEEVLDERLPRMAAADPWLAAKLVDALGEGWQTSSSAKELAEELKDAARDDRELDEYFEIHLGEDWARPHRTSTDVQLMSRLQRLPVSDAKLAEIYGPHWAEVLLFCLRAEAADLEMVRYLAHGREESLHISDLIDDPLTTRHALAAYQLATIACPFRSGSEQESAPGLERGRIARRLAVAMGKVAAGGMVAWLDQLPAPLL